jgi:uncharacterized Tic20 family protein
MSSNPSQPLPGWPAPRPAPAEPPDASPGAGGGFAAGQDGFPTGPQERLTTGPQERFSTGPQERFPAGSPDSFWAGPQERLTTGPGRWPTTRAPWPGPAAAQPAGDPGSATGPQPPAAAGRPGAAAQPAPAEPGDERLAVLGYLGVPFLGPLLPLAIYLFRKRSSGFVRSHSAQALNLSLTVLLYTVCALILFAMLALDTITIALVIAVPLAVALWLATLAYVIVAASRANDGGYYPIPGWLCASLVH